MRARAPGSGSRVARRPRADAASSGSALIVKPRVKGASEPDSVTTRSPSSVAPVGQRGLARRQRQAAAHRRRSAMSAAAKARPAPSRWRRTTASRSARRPSRSRRCAASAHRPPRRYPALPGAATGHCARTASKDSPQDARSPGCVTGRVICSLASCGMHSSRHTSQLTSATMSTGAAGRLVRRNSDRHQQGDRILVAVVDQRANRDALRRRPVDVAGLPAGWAVASRPAAPRPSHPGYASRRASAGSVRNAGPARALFPVSLRRAPTAG